MPKCYKKAVINMLYFPTAVGTETLKATVSPANTTQSKNVTWSSADESIAEVDKNGKVTAVKGGRTKHLLHYHMLIKI